MQVVYDNIIFSLQGSRGISLYWAELIKRLVRANVPARFYGSDGGNFFSDDLPISAEKESCLPTALLRYTSFRRRLSPGSIFHSSYYRIARQAGVRNIVTVHDFIWERFGNGVRRLAHIAQKRVALQHAAGIICISESTKRDLVHYHPNIDVPVEVIYHGVSEHFRPLPEGERDLSRSLGIPAGTRPVLFVGARNGYKNFLRAVEVVESLPPRYHLLAVGGGPVSASERLLLEARLPERYHHYLNVGGEALNRLYNAAFCLLYPSAYEGFGLPVVEAMRAGCPVVAVRSSSIPEIAGDSALLADSASTADLFEKVNSLRDPGRRSYYVEKGLLRAQSFSWDVCFDRTYDFYRRVA